MNVPRRLLPGAMVLAEYYGEQQAGVVLRVFERREGRHHHPRLWIECLWSDGEIDCMRLWPETVIVPRKKDQKSQNSS